MQQKFSDSVLFKCHELSTEAPRSLIDLLNRPSSPSHTGTLNLTGHTLTSKLCSALAFALKDDDTYNSAIIGDCFLGDEGTIHLVNGLKTNHKVKHLDLRGNNIRSDGSTALSQMLKLNSTLESLSLEWNCIGIWETGTQAIADALANNHTLQEIDLRNNKIGPQGIQSLALALKHNTTLKRLDLRWNNAGIVGGRAIVECLKWNNTIIELDLTGNEIPEDILTSIAISIERNKENYRNQVHQSAHSAHLSSTIQALTTSHADTLRSYTTKFHSSESSRATLTSQLEKSVVEIKALSQINRDLESKLSTITAEKAQLEETLQDEKQKSLQRIDNLQRDLVSISESRLKSESTHGKQINELERRCFEIEALKNELEVKCEVLKRDKKMMIEDFDRAKEREQNLSNNMEGIFN